MKIFRLYFSQRWWWTTIIMLLVVTVTIRLGFWQLDRMKSRQVSVAHLRAMLSAEPLDLNVVMNTSDLPAMEYRSAVAQGSYDFNHQIALRNQFWGDPDGTAEYGYHLLTPLVLDTGQAVLVDRGWIPGKYNSPESWRQFDKGSNVTSHGILRVPLLKGEMGGGVPDPTPVPGESGLAIWNYLDFERIQRQLPYPLLPVYLQEAPGEGALTLPYKSSPGIDTDGNTHAGYAAMWFFYTVLVFLGYPVYLRRQETARRIKTS